ncbi:unnamed protein product [Dracunculus medinensis]|uniref:Protein kinase domain-containing protein n=1 Tax=Dracunculus medinensis TaxID=318479 RepID=A0A0N4UG91_DRAME|nr:unnamed protein product [Dracunculus medinensis]
MGGRCSKGASSPTHPQFSDFSVYRSIGRGTFGRVCIVQYRSNKKLYAMKYMDKRRCVQRMAANMVLRELDLLAHLSHPFIVNLWFSFQHHSDFLMAIYTPRALLEGKLVIFDTLRISKFSHV